MDERGGPVAGQRRSRHRLHILEIMADRTDHPTAQDVHAALIKQGHAVGLATVYRNLAQLVEAGLLRTVEVDGTVRYDPHVAPHAHLIDARGAVTDLPMPAEVMPLLERVLAEAGLDVDIAQVDLVVRAAE